MMIEKKERKDIKMDEVYIRTQDMAKFIKEDYFDNRDFVTLEDFYRAFEQLSDDYDRLKEEFEDFKENVEENYKYTPQT